MPNLKIPSLQHLARIWRDTPEGVEREFLALAKNGPKFSYEPLKNLTFDILNFGISEEQVVSAISAKEKRESVLKTFLEIVPLLYNHCRNVAPQYVQEVAPQYYSLGRGFRIPFSPTLVYEKNNEMILPWFVFWKTNTFTKDQLSLFVTLVEEMLLQDPDLENAKLQILNFSAPKGGGRRVLNILNSGDIPKLSHARKVEMLEIFIEGFERAREILFNDEANKASVAEKHSHSSQLSLLEN